MIENPMILAPASRSLLDKNGKHFLISKMIVKSKEWQRRDTNSRLRRDWCLKPVPLTARPRYLDIRCQIRDRF